MNINSGTLLILGRSAFSFIALILLIEINDKVFMVRLIIIQVLCSQLNFILLYDRVQKGLELEFLIFEIYLS